MSGKKKWIVGGIGAAVVAMGAVMLMGRGKSREQDQALQQTADAAVASR